MFMNISAHFAEEYKVTEVEQGNTRKINRVKEKTHVTYLRA